MAARHPLLWILLISLPWSVSGNEPYAFKSEYELLQNGSLFGKTRIWSELEGPQWIWHSESRLVGVLSLFTSKKPTKMSRLQVQPKGAWQLQQYQESKTGKAEDLQNWQMLIPQQKLQFPNGQSQALPANLFDSQVLPVLIQNAKDNGQSSRRFNLLRQSGVQPATLQQLGHETLSWQNQPQSAEKWQMQMDGSHDDLLELWLLPQQLGVVPLQIRRTRGNDKMQELRLISYQRL